MLYGKYVDGVCQQCPSVQLFRSQKHTIAKDCLYGRKNMRKIKGCFTLILILVILIAAGRYFLPQIGHFISFQPTAVSSNNTGILLVNAWNPLPDDFAPKELVNLYEQKRHFLLATSDIYLEREAFEAANRMFKQAEQENMNGFILTSGYRTSEKQAELYAQQQDGTAQLPGHSEHETGLAFDVTTRRDSGGFETTDQFRWLIDNCWDFGFILRYPEGAEDITGIPYEPWHYRYVGVEAALLIRDNGWTLEEYVANN